MAVTWELDFYSRPILDENQKKRWEILICESVPGIGEARNGKADGEPFRYARYCKNTEVNSITLGEALQEAIAQAGGPPARVRFFRQAMKNAIVKACQDAGLTAALSRRTFALNDWLAERMETVYPQEPGFQGNASNPSVAMPPPAAQPMPDALQGQKWAFVTLEAAAFADLPDWEIDFGEAFPLAMADVSPEAKIPGLLVFSPRAKALAAWMSGLEMGFVTVEQQVKPSSLSTTQTEFPDQIVLETGVADRWVFANLPDNALKQEGRSFETAKDAASGVHFLAVQQTPEDERFAGFWMMRETPLP